MTFLHLIQALQLRSSQPRFGVAFRILEIEIVFGSVFAKLGGGDVHADFDGVRISGLFHCHLDQLQSFFVLQNVGRETAYETKVLRVKDVQFQKILRPNNLESVYLPTYSHESLYHYQAL